MRMKTKADRLNNRKHFISEGSTVIRSKFCDSIAIIGTSKTGSPTATIFRGSAGKPEINCYYRSEERRNEVVARFFDSLKVRRDDKEQRAKQKKAAGRGLEVGDVVSTCWGYDQTNVEYYKVTKLIGKTMVEIVEIGQQVRYDAMDQGECIPDPSNVIGKPQRVKAINGTCKADGHRASKVSYTEVAGTRIYKSRYWTAYH